MASNPYYNKIVIGGQTKIDLTGDTAEEAQVLYGFTFHKKSGAPATGSCTFDADTSDANASADDILYNKKAYVAGQKVTGTIPLKIGDIVINEKNDEKAITRGYWDGTGKARINSTEQEKIIPGNIKQGVTILGVVGEYSGGTVSAQPNKNVTPSFSAQEINPDTGYDYLAKVTVAAIPVTETDNAQGGKTLTIG